jgi:hypothetical protein
MADSADDLLARAREAMADDLYALGAGGAYVELKDAVSELDALLSAGGPLPTAWADCTPVRTVADAPGPDGIITAVAHVQDQPSLSGTGTLSFPDSEIPDTWAFDEPGSERAALISGLAAALRSMAEKDAEISRLTAELDTARNVPVEYVITAGLEAAMAADPHRTDGTILRATDGKREAWRWSATAKTWEQVT